MTCSQGIFTRYFSKGELLGKEIEVAYYNVDRADLVKKLRAMNAKFIGKFYLRRANFQIATRGNIGSPNYYTSWVRVRSDGRKTTVTLKEQRGNSITGRREYEMEVSSFDDAIKILSKILPNQKIDYFENSRELYELNGLKFSIDKFPKMPYLLEIEGSTKREIYSFLSKVKIKGEIDGNKSVPTSEYYKMHNVDYAQVQKMYQKKIQNLLKER